MKKVALLPNFASSRFSLSCVKWSVILSCQIGTSLHSPCTVRFVCKSVGTDDRKAGVCSHKAQQKTTHRESQAFISPPSACDGARTHAVQQSVCVRTCAGPEAGSTRKQWEPLEGGLGLVRTRLPPAAWHSRSGHPCLHDTTGPSSPKCPATRPYRTHDSPRPHQSANANG